MIRSLLAVVVTLAASLAHAAVNLNTATKEELVALSGIGPAKAQAITRPGKPAPEPRSTQTRAPGASGNSCSESAI